MPGTTQLECKVTIIQPTLRDKIKQHSARVMKLSPRRSVKKHFAEAFKIQNVNYDFVVFISIEWDGSREIVNNAHNIHFIL